MGSLIKIEGNALEKLIDVVSLGIGTLYRPRQIRKEADAQAYAIRVIGKAQAEVETEARLIELETEERISKRIIARESKRQDNIDAIVEMAANNLKGESVSEEPVDIDWATRFFGIVQDVSREEMQILWARILAKEIERPSSFSMRTLEVLRNISFNEAETFEKVAQFILFQNDYFIYNNETVLDQFGIHYLDLALLKECGLLQSGDLVKKNYDSKPDRDMVAGIVYGKYIILMTIPKGAKKIRIPVILLTKVGQEIFSLLEPATNMEYLVTFAKEINKNNPGVTVQYAESVSWDGNQVSYRPPLFEL